MQGLTYKARFDRKGCWKGKVVYLSENGLPQTVKDGFKKSKYRNRDVRSSYGIYMPGEETKYHVRVAKNDLRKKRVGIYIARQLVKNCMAI